LTPKASFGWWISRLAQRMKMARMSPRATQRGEDGSGDPGHAVLSENGHTVVLCCYLLLESGPLLLTARLGCETANHGCRTRTLDMGHLQDQDGRLEQCARPRGIPKHAGVVPLLVPQYQCLLCYFLPAWGLLEDSEATDLVIKQRKISCDRCARMSFGIEAT
jgi:hypothetical protein